MARIYNKQTVEILEHVSRNPGISTRELYKALGIKVPYKDFYNNIYRLLDHELLDRQENNKGIVLTLSEEGRKIFNRVNPEKDGIWKLVIFDIPEKQKKVRGVLRAKLKQLHFKKWQNSIWISPYALDREIEDELNQLAKHYFVRLIKTQDINQTQDLEKMFS
ncbi:MAG: hypothetical protein M1333_00995 [Patescibacteria group bacterium]|nr:hypothetical protein [Patescibacteria group bacterium]